MLTLNTTAHNNTGSSQRKLEIWKHYCAVRLTPVLSLTVDLHHPQSSSSTCRVDGRQESPGTAPQHVFTWSTNMWWRGGGQHLKTELHVKQLRLLLHLVWFVILNKNWIQEVMSPGLWGSSSSSRGFNQHSHWLQMSATVTNTEQLLHLNVSPGRRRRGSSTACKWDHFHFRFQSVSFKIRARNTAAQLYWYMMWWRKKSDHFCYSDKY